MTVPETVDLAAFDPSRDRAEAVSARMQGRLADSLLYIIDRADGIVPLPRTELKAFVSRLAMGPVSPSVFGAYCDLVLALDADSLDEAQTLFREIADSQNVACEPHIRELTDPDHDPDSNRYRRFPDGDPDMPLTIQPPPADLAEN